MNWEELRLPWTREQCRRRYVEGEDNIGVRGLAKMSGVPKGTLERWVRSDCWPAQREKYRETLKVSIQEKTIEKTSDKISDELAEIATANYQAHKLARDYAARVIQAKARQLVDDLALYGEAQKKAVAQHSAAEMNQWSQMLRRSTDAINEIRGVKYFADINAAADKLQREGYEILDPSEV